MAQLAASDVVILALPAEASRPWLTALLEAGAPRILDLSDAMRRDPAAHYGIPELLGAAPKGTRVIANPGCYPTATLLGLVPLLRAGLIEASGIGVIGASGASGAGKALREDLHFCNLVDNPFPYKIGSHRHQPEIEAHLGAPISFVTQILPVQRGMMVTSFVRPTASPDVLRGELERAYAQHPYVHVLSQAGPALGMRHVVGTHDCRLAVGSTASSGLVPVFATIDNLMRGAASQALHNLNLWFDRPASMGLPTPQSADSHDLIPPMHGAAIYPPEHLA